MLQAESTALKVDRGNRVRPASSSALISSQRCLPPRPEVPERVEDVDIGVEVRIGCFPPNRPAPGPQLEVLLALQLAPGVLQALIFVPFILRRRKTTS